MAKTVLTVANIDERIEMKKVGTRMVKRLFIHPTFDCSFDKVCRDDCYLLKDKGDTDKMFRLPDSYWMEVVRSSWRTWV